MANGLNNRVFDMMEAIADETAVDFSIETLNRVLPRSALGKAVEQSDFEKSIPKRLNVGQKKAGWTFDKFMKHLKSLYGLKESESNKIKELWIAGGKPIINIQEKGTKFGLFGDVNRASFIRLRDEYGADQINIFEHTLLDDFVAEISHSKKYARKPNETKANWIKRRNELDNLASRERERYGEGVYGKERKGKKYFPTAIEEEYFEVETRDGKQVVVDEKGNIRLDIEVPPGEETPGGFSQILGWSELTSVLTEFNPETRLGIGGEKLTQEFEAHRVVEDSLWNVLFDSGLFVNKKGDLSSGLGHLTRDLKKLIEKK